MEEDFSHMHLYLEDMDNQEEPPEYKFTYNIGRRNCLRFCTDPWLLSA